jgi:hypothetical protein
MICIPFKVKITGQSSYNNNMKPEVTRHVLKSTISVILSVELKWDRD